MLTRMAGANRDAGVLERVEVPRHVLHPLCHRAGSVLERGRPHLGAAAELVLPLDNLQGVGQLPDQRLHLFHGSGVGFRVSGERFGGWVRGVHLLRRDLCITQL